VAIQCELDVPFDDVAHGAAVAEGFAVVAGSEFLANWATFHCGSAGLSFIDWKSDSKWSFSVRYLRPVGLCCSYFYR
jgi:hypothetical protein